MENIVDADLYFHNSYAVKSDGSLYGWGINKEGQLGTGNSNEYEKNPVKITNNVCRVYSYHDENVFIIKRDKSLWGWGVNDGVVGNGSRTQQNVPYKIMEDVAKFYYPGSSALAIKNDGSLWMWGAIAHTYDVEYVTNPKHLADSVIDLSGNATYLYYIKMNNELWYKSTNSNRKIKDNIIKVSANGGRIGGNVMAITSDGELWGHDTNYTTMKLIHESIPETAKVTGIANPSEEINLYVGQSTLIIAKLFPEGAEYKSMSPLRKPTLFKRKLTKRNALSTAASPLRHRLRV
mgnify:CR=1 FL=1